MSVGYEMDERRQVVGREESDLRKKIERLETFLAFGIQNKQTMVLAPLSAGSILAEQYIHGTGVGYQAGGVNNPAMHFNIPLPPVKDDLTLVIDKIITHVVDAAGGDNIESLSIYGIKYDSSTAILTNGQDSTDLDDLLRYETDFTAISDMADFEIVYLVVATTIAGAADLNFFQPIMEYHYE